MLHFRPAFRQGAGPMLLLLDVGNTHTHFAFATGQRLFDAAAVETLGTRHASVLQPLLRKVRARKPDAISFCSVVPKATPHLLRALRRACPAPVFELTHQTVRGVGIEYPAPATIGTDRLANAVAARAAFGAPAVVVDFGTAVTFDVVNGRGNYVGGIIAPGLAAMTSYLHEKTALLPRIEIRETAAVIGKSTAEAMLIGAVHGYRGLIRELIGEIQRELGCGRLPVVATGGYARLMARRLPEITAVDPLLTLRGLRLAWQLSPQPPMPAARRR